QHYLNAIITVNPDTGQVTLDALDAYRAEFNTSISNINQELDAINGKFTVKVWQTDIDAMGNSTLAAVDSEFLARSGVCSLSGFTNAADCIANNGTWTLSSLSQEKKTLLAYSDQGEANSKAYADSITTVVADKLSAEVLRVDGINTQVGSAESNITNLQSSVTAIEGENYTLQINNATSRLTSTEGDIGSLQTDVANVQSSTYTKAESDSTVAGVLDYISVSDTGSKDALVADALISNALSAANEMDQRRTANAVIISNAETSKANDEVIAKTADLLQVNLGDTNASILTEQTTRADADSALAIDISTVQTTLGDDIATVQSQATATSSVADGLLVKYSVKLDVNGYVTGFAQNNNGTTGSFFVRADEFAIIDPASTTDQSEMTAQQITDSVPFSVVSGKTYIKNADIKDLTATNIAAGAVTADKISVANLSAVSANIGTVKVYNANIVDAAITNAKIANAAITNAKIANAAISSAKIANAAITTAKIGTAQVDTLEIKGQAVTIPTSAFLSGGSYINGSVVIDVYHVATGAPITVFFSAYIVSDSRTTITLYRDSTVLFTSSAGTQEFAKIISDTPSAGGHWYKVEAYHNGYSGINTITSLYLGLLETKR
nr:DUF1983 domain-containing protein [Thiomicrorhabdus sp.]